MNNEVIIIILLAVIVALLVYAIWWLKRTTFDALASIISKIERCDAKLGFISSDTRSIRNNTEDSVSWSEANNEMLQEFHKRLTTIVKYIESDDSERTTQVKNWTTFNS